MPTAEQADRGAFRIRIGSNAGAVAHAVAISAQRRDAYRAGRYVSTDDALIWSRRDLPAGDGD